MARSWSYKLKILVIEDSEDQIEIFRQRLLLAKIDHELTCAASGEQGLSLLQEAGPNQKLPDLIMLDLRMPGMNGLDVLKTVQARPEWQSIPVIVLSVSDDLQDVVKTYKLGGTFFMKKPFDPKVFEQVVTQLKMTGRINVPMS